MDPLVLSYVFNGIFLLLLIAAPILSFMALYHLRRQRIQGIELVLWLLVVISIPLLGPIAYFITAHNKPAR